MALRIRPAKPADLECLLVMCKALDEAIGNTNPLFIRQNRPFLKKILFGKPATAYALLAEQDGKPVGYVVYYYGASLIHAQPIIHLEDLYVEAAYRGNGIAQHLMKHLAKVGHKKKCCYISWMVLKDNKDVHGFYGNLGAKFSEDANGHRTMMLNL